MLNSKLSALFVSVLFFIGNIYSGKLCVFKVVEYSLCLADIFLIIYFNIGSLFDMLMSDLQVSDNSFLIIYLNASTCGATFVGAHGTEWTPRHHKNGFPL